MNKQVKFIQYKQDWTTAGSVSWDSKLENEYGNIIISTAFTTSAFNNLQVFF